MEQVLEPQHYFEDTKIESIELFSMHNKNKNQIRKAYHKDTELQEIENTVKRGEKEMKGIAIGR